MSIHAHFVVARGTGRRVTWQINGAGPRLSIRLAWSRLADLCPRPEIADELLISAPAGDLAVVRVVADEHGRSRPRVWSTSSTTQSGA